MIGKFTELPYQAEADAMQEDQRPRCAASCFPAQPLRRRCAPAAATRVRACAGAGSGWKPHPEAEAAHPGPHVALQRVQAAPGVTSNHHQQI